MDKTIYILRGVSSSGKTTLAQTLCQLPNTKSIAADDYFYNGNDYNFRALDLGKAHDWCREGVDSLMCQEHDIVLHNTSTTEKEINPYLDLAAQYGYKVVSLIIEKRHGNTNDHNVPEHTLARQEKRLRNSIKLR